MSLQHTLSFFKSSVVRPVFVFLGITVTFFVAWGAGSTTPKGQLYIPFTLITTQLQKDFKVGSPLVQGQIPAQSLSVDGLSWQTSPVNFDFKMMVQNISLNSKGFSAQVPKVSAHISLDQISIDQVITEDVGGATINVHVQATCGPILLTQTKASISTAFALDWATGAPLTHLSSMDLKWAADSWQVSPFTCQGPANLGQVVHDQIAKSLADAAVFKPILAQYMSTQIQNFLDQSLAKIRIPFDVSEGPVNMPIKIGNLSATNGGVIADVTFNGTNAAPATALPSEKTLASLPQDRPSLLAGIDLIELAVSQQLATQPSDSMLNLQTIPAFHDLLKSCLIELFVWPDLLNYSSNTPFYLRVHNPGSLSLSLNSQNQLTSQVPLYAVVQSWRDKTWWSYLIINGTASATVSVTVGQGSMSYATSVGQPNVRMNYGEAYAARYGAKSFPKDQLINALNGPASQFSGTMVWPDIDLSSAGVYTLDKLVWVDQHTFALSWAQKK